MIHNAECHFRVDLRTPAGEQTTGMLLCFPDIESACCDVYAALPSIAAELLRDGIDPMACAYLIRDEAGQTLIEIAMADLVRGAKQPNVANDRWLTLNAELKRRSEDAIERTERATSRIASLITQASTIGR